MNLDLAKNSELTEFCRSGLDPIIKDEETKCGLLVVHHTNKPPSDAGELRQMARELFGKQHGDRVQSELVHNFSKYGLVMRKGANNNVQIYGREDMFR